MDGEVENAEILLQKFDIHQVDFSKHSTLLDNVAPVAADLVFIMKNAALFEPQVEASVEDTIQIDHHDNSVDLDKKSEKDSSSEIEIIDIPKTKKDTIYISSSEEDAEPQQSLVLDSSVSSTKRPGEKNNEKICSKVLKRMVWKVDAILRNVAHSDENFDSSDSDDDFNEQDRVILRSIIEDEEKVPNYIPKVANEVLPEELEVDNEVIELKEDDTLLGMGVISGVVEKMIVIKANKDTPALDAETALFLGDKMFLGKIFDTFGPVKTPFYSVQLSERVDASKLSKGNNVHFVPFNQNITRYVFVEQLKKLKGSDASWMNDCEPPPHHLDYSDDEEERRAKSELKGKRQLEKDDSTTGEDNSNTKRKEPSKNQRKIQKKRIIDLTRGHNPILEHAKMTNNPSFNKGKALFNKVHSNQRDIPLSEFLQDDNTSYNNNQELQREANFEYVSPLHQSNPKPNRHGQQENVRSQNMSGKKQFQKPFNNDDAQSNPNIFQSPSQNKPDARQQHWNGSNGGLIPNNHNPQWQPHSSYQSPVQQPARNTMPYGPPSQHQPPSPGPSNYFVPPNHPSHAPLNQAPYRPPNRTPYGAPIFSSHGPHNHAPQWRSNHPPHGPSNLLHEPSTYPPHGPPNQPQNGPPSQSPQGPPSQPPHGPPSQPQHGPPCQPPHGLPSQSPQAPLNQSSHSQHGPPNHPPHNQPYNGPLNQPPHGPPNQFQHSQHGPQNHLPHNQPSHRPPNQSQHVPSNQSLHSQLGPHNHLPHNKLHNGPPTQPLHVPCHKPLHGGQHELPHQEANQSYHGPENQQHQNFQQQGYDAPPSRKVSNPYYSSFLEMSYENSNSNNDQGSNIHSNRHPHGPPTSGGANGPISYNTNEPNPYGKDYQNDSNVVDHNQNKVYDYGHIGQQHHQPPHHGGGYKASPLPPSHPPNHVQGPSQRDFNPYHQQQSQFQNPAFPRQDFGVRNRRPQALNNSQTAKQNLNGAQGF